VPRTGLLLVEVVQLCILYLKQELSYGLATVANIIRVLWDHNFYPKIPEASKVSSRNLTDSLCFRKN